MKKFKKVTAMALLSCMVVGSTMSMAGAVNTYNSEDLKSQTALSNVETRGTRSFTKYITSGESIKIWDDSNWWPADDVAVLSLKKTEGPSKLSIRIEQEVDGKWVWAGGGSLTSESSVTARLKKGGTSIRIMAYKDAGADGYCTFKLQLTH